MLRFTEAKMRITRVDRILLHKTSQLCLVSPADEATDILALNGRLERTGRTGRAQPVVSGSGCYELSVALCASPLVSIVIPTAARVIDYEGRRIDLVAQCLETIIARSTYKNIEFIIIDNGDFDRDRIAHISLQKITFLTYSLPEINIAKKINLGASRASGSVILILNDDVVPIAPDWIERMLAHLEKPHVGVVGAKLLYPNDTFQHVGVVVCDGLPEHVRRGWPRADEGYAFSSVSVRNYLAVTGAVSMVRREHFKHVGGYSEDLPIDYNDIDFSYKLANAGFTVVFEPRAELYHYESVSVVKPVELHDAMRFAKKWAVIPDDPFYDQYCFSKHPATYKLSYSERKY
jgi:GT2 family glycosyltransferase